MYYHYFFITLIVMGMNVAIQASELVPVFSEEKMLNSPRTRRQSSPIFRYWAQKILTKGNHSNPGQIKIVNSLDSDGDDASAHFESKTIYFDEKSYSKYSLGVQLATVAHEAAHLIIHDARLSVPNDVEGERMADTMGLTLSQCESCAIDETEDNLKRLTKNIHAKIAKNLTDKGYDQELIQNMPLTLDTLRKTSALKRKKYTEMARNADMADTHPNRLERAYYIFELSQSKELKHKQCEFHEAHRKRKLTVDKRAVKKQK